VKSVGSTVTHDKHGNISVKFSTTALAYRHNDQPYETFHSSHKVTVDTAMHSIQGVCDHQVTLTITQTENQTSKLYTLWCSKVKYLCPDTRGRFNWTCSQYTRSRQCEWGGLTWAWSWRSVAWTVGLVYSKTDINMQYQVPRICLSSMNTESSPASICSSSNITTKISN